MAHRADASAWLLALLAGCTTQFDIGRLDGGSSLLMEGGNGRRDAADGEVVVPPDAPGMDGAEEPEDGGGEVDGGRPEGPCPEVFLRRGILELYPDAMPLPARGEFFRDPIFRTCMARVSDLGDLPAPRGVDQVTHGQIAHDGSLAIQYIDGSTPVYYDLDPIQYLGRVALASAQSQQPIFHPTDANRVINRDLFLLREERIVERTNTTIFDAATASSGFPGATQARLALVSTSSDGNVFALSITTNSNDPIGLLVWNRTMNRVVGQRTLVDLDRVAITPSGRHIVHLRGSTFTVHAVTGSGLGPARVLADVTGPDDNFAVARLPNDHDALVFLDWPRIVAHDLDQGDQRILNYALEQPFPAPIRFDAAFSGAAVDRPGWVVVSVGGCGLSSPCPAGTQWTEDRLFLLELRNPPLLLNLAHHRSIGWGTRLPHPIPNRDLTRIIFQTDWGDLPNRQNTFVIELPRESVPDARNP